MLNVSLCYSVLQIMFLMIINTVYMKPGRSSKRIEENFERRVNRFVNMLSASWFIKEIFKVSLK